MSELIPKEALADKEISVQLFLQNVDELRTRKDDLEKALRELTQQTLPATNWDAIAKSPSMSVKLLYKEHQNVDAKLGTLFSSTIKIPEATFDEVFK